jgi:hypothetical protein
MARAKDEDQAANAIQTAWDFHYRRFRKLLGADTTMKLLRVLRDVYPATGGGCWGGLGPDSLTAGLSEHQGMRQSLHGSMLSILTDEQAGRYGVFSGAPSEWYSPPGRWGVPRPPPGPCSGLEEASGQPRLFIGIGRVELLL